MKATIPIAISPGTKVLRIERYPKQEIWEKLDGQIITFPEDGYWKIWLYTNNFIHGTFIELHDDGSMNRVTIRTDETEEIVLIKEADK